MNNLGLYLRTIIFGVTDSLVSTVGLLAGIDVAGAPHATLALTGIIYAFVEAFSMAVGSFLSEESAEEYAAKRSVPLGQSLVAGVVMFVSFVLAAFIPLAPYLTMGDPYVLPASIGLSVIALFVLGFISGSVSKLPMVVRGMRMALLGGAAIIIGTIVGLVVKVA